MIIRRGKLGILFGGGVAFGALFTLLALAGPAASWPHVPIPPSPWQIEVTVVELAPDHSGDSLERLEAEMAAEKELWNRGATTESLVTLARFEGPTVLHYPIRLEIPQAGRLAVTVVERDRRRVRLLLTRTIGEDRSDRVVRFRLNRSFRPAEGRVVVPLDENRWLRVWLRRP